MSTYYTPEQIESLKAAEEAVSADDIAEQWAPRGDLWRVNYPDDLSRIDPLVDRREQPIITDAPQLRFRDEDTFERDVAERMMYGGMSTKEMFEAIEKADISEKMKTGLRSLRRWVGTPKESGVKEILYRFVPKRGDALARTDGKPTILELFDEIETLQMPEIKKAEVVALRHWAGTEKGEALRPMLERHIAENPKTETPGPTKTQTPEERDLDELHKLMKRKLGFDPTDSLLFIDSPDLHRLNDPIYNVEAPPIPKLKHPFVRFGGAEEDDRMEAALARVSLQTGMTKEELRKFQVKQLVMHRVVNQTRMGKIQSMYTLAIAGNGKGLIGIGEGKAAEPEDSVLQSRVNALRNIQPIHRYENRTIYGEVNAKVGACTVDLSARPPGKQSHTPLF
jgi:hypothetical protein